MKVQLLFILFLGFSFSTCKVNHLAEQETQFYRITDEQTTNDSVDQLIAPYKTQLDAEMNKVIGEVAHELTKKLPESTMGNWFSDIIFEQSQKLVDAPIDFTTLNHGGLRIPSIPKGPITKGKIYELMPFDNSIVILDLDAKTTKQLFDRIAVKGGWPISKHVQFEIRDNKAENITINGKPLEPNRIYRVSLPDYIANGGDKCFFLSDNKKRVESGVLIRDALIDYVQECQNKNIIMKAEIEGRIKNY